MKFTFFKDRNVLKFILFAWLPAYLFGLFGLSNINWLFSSHYPIVLSSIGFIVFQGLGVHLGYHRLFSHQSFVTYRVFSVLLAYFGCLSFQNSAIFWSAIHRNHHKYSDKNKDPHTPKKGLFYSFQAWYFKPHLLSPRDGLIVRDLLSDKALFFLHRHNYKIMWISILGAAILFSVQTAIYLFFVPALFGFLTVGLVNILCHLPFDIPFVSYRNYETKDNSRNAPVFSLFSFGLSLHNNHHRDPGAACYSRKWYEIDPLKWVIAFVEKR